MHSLVMASNRPAMASQPTRAVPLGFEGLLQVFDGSRPKGHVGALLVDMVWSELTGFTIKIGYSRFRGERGT